MGLGSKGEVGKEHYDDLTIDTLKSCRDKVPVVKLDVGTSGVFGTWKPST